MVGRGDDDGLDVLLLLEHDAEVGVLRNLGELVGEAVRGAGFIDVAEGDDVLAGDVVEVGAARPPRPMTAMLRRSMGPAGAAGGGRRR